MILNLFPVIAPLCAVGFTASGRTQYKDSSWSLGFNFLQVQCVPDPESQTILCTGTIHTFSVIVDSYNKESGTKVFYVCAALDHDTLAYWNTLQALQGVTDIEHLVDRWRVQSYHRVPEDQARKLLEPFL